MSAATTPDLLAAIVAATRHTVAVRAATCSMADLGRTQVRQPAGEAFLLALTAPGGYPRVIAECKRRSPSRGILRSNYDPAAHATAYAAAGAAAISVLTEPSFFDGSVDHLRAVRDAVSVPILRKDFIVSEYQLVEAAVAGADAVLLIVGALADPDLRLLMGVAGRMGLATLVEVHDSEQLRRAVDAGARIIGVNSRNLRTLQVDPAVLNDLSTLIPDDVTAVAESGIRSVVDLDELTAQGYAAFLVGERLIAHDDPGAALRELRGR